MRGEIGQRQPRAHASSTQPGWNTRLEYSSFGRVSAGSLPQGTQVGTGLVPGPRPGFV